MPFCPKPRNTSNRISHYSIPTLHQGLPPTTAQSLRTGNDPIRRAVRAVRRALRVDGWFNDFFAVLEGAAFVAVTLPFIAQIRSGVDCYNDVWM
jgi:hypothetical protein